MGGVQSKDPVVLPNKNESSIKFSPQVLSQLSTNLSTTQTSPEREQALDKHVRQRIAAELAALHAQEEEVKRAMREALEKENLGREKALSDEATGSRGTLSLSEDIEAVKTRVERYAQRRALAAESGSAVEDSRKAVVQCYKLNPERPLDCWKEVEQFRVEVAKLENKFVDSLK